MNTKPVPKKEVCVQYADKSLRWITFYSTPDALTEFATFGRLLPAATLHPDAHRLSVDPRYDFDEVLAYIEAYG